MSHIDKAVSSMVAGIGSPEISLRPVTPIITAEVLHDIDQKYGPHGDDPLEYHNTSHSIDVGRRVIRLTNLLYPYIPEQYRTSIYDLGFLGPGCHDSEQLLGSGANERASLDDALRRIEQANDPVLTAPAFTDRLGSGIMVTVVNRKEDGELEQVNLREGDPDPFKFIMAFCDINGIAMEGDMRMIKDATHLCYELFGEPSTEQLYDFLLSQAGFLRDRLNDHRIKADIAYYFPDHQDEVYKVMRSSFHSNITSAYRLATFMSDHSELSDPIGKVIKTADKTHAGRLIGRLIRQQVRR